jgi:hypothetical protein
MDIRFPMFFFDKTYLYYLTKKTYIDIDGYKYMRTGYEDG